MHRISIQKGRYFDISFQWLAVIIAMGEKVTQIKGAYFVENRQGLCEKTNKRDFVTDGCECLFSRRCLRRSAAGAFAAQMAMILCTGKPIAGAKGGRAIPEAERKNHW